MLERSIQSLSARRTLLAVAEVEDEAVVHCRRHRAEHQQQRVARGEPHAPRPAEVLVVVLGAVVQLDGVGVVVRVLLLVLEHPAPAL